MYKYISTSFNISIAYYKNKIGLAYIIDTNKAEVYSLVVSYS